MVDPCFTSHDNLHHETLTSSTVQILTANYWWRLLSLSVCMHLSAFLALTQHKSWNSQTSKTAITLPLLTHRVKHSASVIMQWSQIYLNLSLSDSHLVFSFFNPSYLQWTEVTSPYTTSKCSWMQVRFSPSAIKIFITALCFNLMPIFAI